MFRQSPGQHKLTAPEWHFELGGLRHIARGNSGLWITVVGAAAAGRGRGGSVAPRHGTPVADRERELADSLSLSVLNQT